MDTHFKLNLHRFEVSDEIAIEIVASSNKAIDALGNLDGAISKTIEHFKSLSVHINNTSSALRSFKDGFSELKTVTSEMKDFTNNISTGFENVIKSTSNGTKTFNKWAQAIVKGKDSVNNHNNEINKATTVLGKFISNLNSTTKAISNTNKSTNLSINAFNGFSKSITGVMVRFRIISGTVKGIAGGMLSLIGKAADYEEALNLYTVSLGKYAEEGKRWANEISNALYLDPTTIYQYEGALNNLITGLDVTSDKAYLMSTNLTQLAFDMSSYLNMDYQTAYDKIQSGISGQIRGLRQAGIALTQASLQELAYSLGIEKSVKNMTEAEKVQLRYIQIMRSTVGMQGDLARTIITPQNALRVTAQQFQLLARAIGRVFIPIVMKAIPLIMALTQVLTNFANWLAKAFGYEIKDIDYSSLQNMDDYITGIGEDADDTSKKIKGMLAPFDELNVVQKSTSSSGSGDLGDTIDFSKWLTGYDMLAGLTDDLKKKTEDAIIPAKTLLGVFGAIFTAKMATNALELASNVGKLAIGLKDGADAVDKLKGVTGFTTSLKAGAKVLGIITVALVDIWAWIKSIDVYTKKFTGFTEFNKGIDTSLSLTDRLAMAISSSIIGTGLSASVIGGLMASAQKVTKSYEIFDKSISETTKKKVEPLVKEFNNLNNIINNLNFGNKVITDKDVTNVKNQLKKISTAIITELDADKNEQLKNLKTLEKSLGATNYENLTKKTESYYNNQKTIVEKNEEEINKILDKANKKGRKLTEGELKKINELRQSTLDTGLRSMTESEEEYAKLRIRIGDETNKLNIKQASEYIKTAKDTKDKAIKNANEQYENIVLEAQKMLDAGEITKGEYIDIVQAARDTKDTTIKEAEKQYNGIVKTTKEKLGENSKYIDSSNGEVLSYWDVFWRDMGTKASKGWNKITKGFSEAWGTVKNFFTKDIPNWWNTEVVPWWDKHVFKYFKKDFWEDKWSKIKIKTPHFKWDEDKGFKPPKTVKKVLEALNLPTTIPKLTIDWYQDGGFPTSGDLFFANENGVPEYITSIGGKSAVANQDQMVSALSNAIMAGLSQIRTNNQPSTTTVYIGNDKVYEGQGEYQSRQADRYGATTVKV